jgi:hypothetical protein
MLGRYLPILRPAPVIALTATATPLVQNDIATPAATTTFSGRAAELDVAIDTQSQGPPP